MRSVGTWKRDLEGHGGRRCWLVVRVSVDRARTTVRAELWELARGPSSNWQFQTQLVGEVWGESVRRRRVGITASI